MASKKDRLEQAAGAAAETMAASLKFISALDGAEPQAASKAPQTETKKKTTRGKAKAVEPVREAVKAPQAGSVVFSFRANPDDVTRYKAYAKARQGLTLSEIGAAAMDEYMAQHKLTAAETAIYDLEMQKADMLKNM